VSFGGHTESYKDELGRYRVRWVPNRVAKGVAYDTPAVGYRVNTANLLRLWKAEAVESFDFDAYNTGDYYGAINAKIFSENITKVLYPNDSFMQGRQLRLEQQYFFASCSLQDMLRIHLASGAQIAKFHECFAVQLNDTHPAIAVAELMRILIDEHLIDWDEAWRITQNTFGYTNHTLMPEALERWPLQLFGSLLPRHLEIIYEINRRFLDEVRTKFPGDDEMVARVSLIDESGEKYVRMANLASVGGNAINGVAELHTELLKTDVLRDFYRIYPERFHNVTNGVTPRRWIALSNPRLADLITSRIGNDWIHRTEEELIRLEAFVDDSEFRRQWREVKEGNKHSLARIIKDRAGVVVDPESLFDIQVKRLHEYKRQHLNVLHIVTLYLRIKNDPQADFVPRTVIFGGKAAPGYAMAKLIIKLINSVAEVVNNDPAVADKLKVVFLPDFNVKNGQQIYPAADLSEQISTAGKEASGTGNMKFAMNGALTIGTLDGANVEIRQAVGAENFFLFGLTVEEVYDLKSRGYNPSDYYIADDRLREAMDLIGLGFFSQGDKDLFKPLVNSLLSRDEYLLLADYKSYVDCQAQVDRAFRDRENWTRMSILNSARMGKFSSDRSILEYCNKIWKTKPVKVEID
jgi:starch phosphorylase